MFVWIKTNRKAFGLNFQALYMILFCSIDCPAVCVSLTPPLLSFSNYELGFPFLLDIAEKMKQIVLVFPVKAAFEWRNIKRLIPFLTLQEHKIRCSFHLHIHILSSSWWINRLEIIRQGTFMWKMKFLLRFIASNELCFVGFPVEIPAEFCHDILKSSLSSLILLLSLRRNQSFWWGFIKFLTENSSNYSISWLETYRKWSQAISDVLI